MAKPRYLMSDGYVKTYRELIEITDWDAYGCGRTPVRNCMAHCGYEPSAVLATMGIPARVDPGCPGT